MASRGQPKRIKTGEQLIELWSEFCDEVQEKGYAVVPTQTEFCRWLRKRFDSCDRKTIYNALNKYFPTIKKDFEQLQGDVIASGAMLGNYNSTMSIFALKNWCKWTDKADISVENKSGQLADLIEGLKEDDIYSETAALDEAVADESA